RRGEAKCPDHGWWYNQLRGGSRRQWRHQLLTLWLRGSHRERRLRTGPLHVPDGGECRDSRAQAHGWPGTRDIRQRRWDGLGWHGDRESVPRVRAWARVDVRERDV